MEADRVAVQCPYSGGPAVYRARTLISIVNDSMQYQDDDVCSILVILRKHSLKNEVENRRLRVFPNPASQSIQLIYSGLHGTTLALEIFDVMGKLILVKNISSLNNTYYLDVTGLENDLYTILLHDNNGEQVNCKFVKAK